jgi:hypothetical protein
MACSAAQHTAPASHAATNRQKERVDLSHIGKGFLMIKTDNHGILSRSGGDQNVQKCAF